MKLALVQCVSSTAWGPNLQWAQTAVAQAAQQGAELVALPEYFCAMGFKDTDKLALQETYGAGPMQDAMSALARQHQVWLVAGTMPLRTPDPTRASNTSLVFAPTGECAARYDKIHLFNYDNGSERYDEARTLQPGTQPVSFDLPSRDGRTWRVGMSVCYDLRFPELYRSLQADLLLVPSAFTHTTGQAHWEVLLRARAIENLAFVGAPAQGGVHENARRTWGHSMVVGPWGEVLGEIPAEPGLVCVELEWDRLVQCRMQLPALAHKTLR
jgi:deaminated glutathione amidase